MANDAVPLPTSDVIHHYGSRSALQPSPISEKSNDGSFLAHISDNPFFTAVSERGLQRWSAEKADSISRDWGLLGLVPSSQSAREEFVMAQVWLKDVYSSMSKSMLKMNPIHGSYTG